jgi:hypothetical protein
MRPVELDGTRHSAVFVCTLCGARDVYTTRGVALAAAATHYDVAHPVAVQAAAQLRVRAAAVVPTRPARA